MDTHEAPDATLLLAHLTALAEGDAVAGSELRAALRDAAGRSGVLSAALVPALLDLLSRLGADTQLGRVLVASLLTSAAHDVLVLLRPVPVFWLRFFSRFADDDAPAPALAWFTSGWSPDGAHRGGAAALSRWALSHRHTGAWSCLRWTGHSQSPVVCASKPATFCELDTRASLGAIMRSGAGDFCSSNELWNELLRDEQTSIVDADPAYFAAELISLLNAPSESNTRSLLLDLLRHTLGQQPLATLVQRALPCISDEEFVQLLPVFEAKSAGGATPGSLLAGAPFAGVRWRSALYAGLAAALARSGGNTLRSLVRDRSTAGVPAAQAAWGCITRLLATPLEEAEARMPPVSAGTSPEEARLRVLLRAWLLRVRLADSTASQLEAYMDAHSISWRRDTPALLDEGRKHKRRRERWREEGGEEASVVAMWRCDLDNWAMLVDAHALANLLADAAADELLRKASKAHNG